MRRVLCLVFFAVFHAGFLFQAAFSLPLTVNLHRRVEQHHLKPQEYAGDGKKGPPTFYHKEHVDHHLQPHEVSAAAKKAYDLIREHWLEKDIHHEHYPKKLVVAALHVPHDHTIHYASQPIGAGRNFFDHVKYQHKWKPSELNAFGTLHAEGHAIMFATDGFKDKDKKHLEGSYVATHGHFNPEEQGRPINPCSIETPNCRDVLAKLKINSVWAHDFHYNPEEHQEHHQGTSHGQHH